MTRRVYRLLVLLPILVVLVGCQRQLIPTPNLYLDRELDPFANVPSPLKTTTVDLLYATDRQIKSGEEGHTEYGYGRSVSLAFGSCVVGIGTKLTWDDLVEASRTKRRSVSLPLRVISVTELGRFPATPPPIVFDGEVAKETADYLAAEARATDALHDELRRRLAMTPRKEAFVYVHGYNTTLDAAAFHMAELWHFLGREGIPIIYSWPAGHPGLIKGYFRDRESGEFTIYHFKEFLKALAACPELSAINVIAHSRGSDVLAAALRELIIAARARGDHPRSVLKFGQIVAAAPDLDMAVTFQRFGAERLYEGWDQLTVYVTKNDRALGSAEWLFSSPRRIGKVRPEQFSEVERERARSLVNSDFVDARVHTDFMGHGYFLSNPATCSDLILVLRYGRRPGAENGRPLTEVMTNYYILDDGYPQKAAPMP